MNHVVVKPFPCRADAAGLTTEHLVPGDVRDFGELAAGLLAEGYIAEIPAEQPGAGGKKKSAKAEPAT